MIRTIGFQPVKNSLSPRESTLRRLQQSPIVGPKLAPLATDSISLRHGQPMFGSNENSVYVTADKTIEAARKEWQPLRDTFLRLEAEHKELESLYGSKAGSGFLGGGAAGLVGGAVATAALATAGIALAPLIPFGFLVGGALGEKSAKKNNEDILELVNRKKREAEAAYAAEDKLWKVFHYEGEVLLDNYKAIEAKACVDSDNPSIDSLTPKDYEELERGFRSPYEEVQDYHRPLMRRLRRVPGFREHYLAPSGGTPRTASSALHAFFAEGVDEVAADTATTHPKAKRLKALRALVPLERGNGVVGRRSKTVYSAAFHDTDPDIRATGLEGMAELGEDAQPPEYVSFLKTALMLPDLGLRRASIKGLKANAMEARRDRGKALSGSGMISVDKVLEQLARPDAPDAQLRTAAAEVIALRKNVEAFDALEPAASALAVTERLVGNDTLRDKLEQYINLYKANAASRNDRGPDLLLTLDGPPGIGKTMFATSMAEELFGPNSLVEINLGEVHSPEQLTAALKVRATHRDKGKAVLGKKVILLDEFHAIANKEPRTLAQIVDVLKPILGKEELSELDLKDTVVIVASNRAPRAIPELQEGTNSALLSRLDRFAHPVRLNRDLRPHIKEVVREFSSQQLYAKDSPALKGVRLDRHARTHFVNELQAAFPTTDPDPVNGRTLVGEIARPIELALAAPATRIERKPGEPFEVTVEDDKLKLTKVDPSATS